MTFNRNYNDSLGSSLSHILFWLLELIQVNLFKDHGGPILPYLEVVSFTKLVIKFLDSACETIGMGFLPGLLKVSPLSGIYGIGAKILARV